MKTVVVFQGGGALGAFGCGVWARLVPWLREHGHTVVAVAGGSIGAINAAIVAHHLQDDDGGAAVLDDVWRGRIATPSFPFLGWSFGDHDWAQRQRSWNGFISGLLIGNRGLYAPQFSHWNPLDGLQRIERPLLDRSRMAALVEAEAPGYDSAGDKRRALLAVSATELMRGEMHLFDSDAGTLGPREVLASASIPLFFEPVAIGDSLYWDGEMVRGSILRELLRRVRASGRAGEREPLQLVTIELMAKRLDELPRSGAEIVYRVGTLLQAEKLGPDEMIDVPGVKAWLRIARGPLPHDAISGQFDFSPERIEALIEQGDAVAREVLDAAEPVSLRAPRRRSPSAGAASSSNHH